MAEIIPSEGVDAGVPWHFGDPLREQRQLDEPGTLVDLSHRGVLSVSGPDRLTWLHSLTTQHLLELLPGVGTTALVLSPQGHIEHVLYGVDDGQTFWAHTEPGAAPAAVEWLDRMRFLMRVEVADRTSEFGVVWRSETPVGTLVPGTRGTSDPGPVTVSRAAVDSLGGRELFVPRSALPAVLAAGGRAGTWAYEARRIAAGVPRIGLDSDHRTIPNELGLIGVAVHLDKGCYRGQETVARVHTLGRPPRRLVRLLLDGSAEALPTPGAPLELDGRAVGFVGSSARHHELGPVALGLMKRNVDPSATLVVDGMAASQEVLVDPEVGLHVRPRLGA
jgi:folate-binding protein YgfZ